MNFIGLVIYVFLELLAWLIFIHIIFSWLTILGIHIRFYFVARIVEPMLQRIGDIFPTKFMGIDFSPIILFLAIGIIQGLVITLFPEVKIYLHQFL